MQFSLLEKKNVRKIAIIISTIALFLLVSYLTIYQTNFSQGKVWSYLGSSDDRFHMMRIEGLYHSLQRHQFFPFINMSFLNGFGYIVNVFYSDFVLYPAAFLRLMGFSSAQTLGLYYLLMNFLTFGVSFLCFYKISQKYINSLLFSFVYTLSTYRLHDMLFRHDIGEIGAMVFLPIAILGIYEIFYGNHKKWLYLTFGMTGVIYSHAISPILIALLIIAVALCRFTEMRENPKRFWALVWATITSALLSIAYFGPMIEQMHHTEFILTQTKSMLPTGASDFADVTNWSLNNTIGQPNIGITLLIAAFIVLISMNKIKDAAVRQFSIIGVVFLICSTKIFPWGLFNNTPLKMIQYPWRFDMLITILLAIFIASDPLELLSGKYAKPILIGLVFLFSLSASYRLVKVAPLQLVTAAQYNAPEAFSIGGGQEYLPTSTRLSEIERMAHKPKIRSGKAKISNFKQYGTRLSFDFKGAKNAKIDLPIIAYYGYQSTQSEGKVSKLQPDEKNNYLAQVKVNGKGKVVVDYFETTVQKFSRRISFLSLLIIVATMFINKLNLVDFSKIEGLRSNSKSK